MYESEKKRERARLEREIKENKRELRELKKELSLVRQFMSRIQPLMMGIGIPYAPIQLIFTAINQIMWLAEILRQERARIRKLELEAELARKDRETRRQMIREIERELAQERRLAFRGSVPG